MGMPLVLRHPGFPLRKRDSPDGDISDSFVYTVTKNNLIMLTYFYRVDEFVKTFGRGESREESYVHSLDFQFETVAESRLQAFAYYQERMDILSREKEYFLPFAPLKDTVTGLIAIFSLTLYLVECYNEDEYYLHGLEGVPENEKAGARKIEAEIFALPADAGTGEET
jgi:hypothetical protein